MYVCVVEVLHSQATQGRGCSPAQRRSPGSSGWGAGGCGELWRAGQALSASTAPAPHWPGREDELQAQQETPIGAAHEVQTKRRHPEGGSIYCLGFLPPGWPIKKYWNTVFLELSIRYLAAWQWLSVGMRNGIGMPRDTLDTPPLE